MQTKSKEDILDEDLLRIIKVSKDLYDFDFSNYAFSSLKRRIFRLLVVFSLNNVNELIEKLKTDRRFFNTFLEEVSVNTTEMFRDPEFWKSLKELVFPKISVYDNIHIWHAGCSTGEEVYSMAIFLHEYGIFDKAKLFATDINQKAMDNARKGQFHKRNIDFFTANYNNAGGKNNFSDYYTLDGDYFKMNPDLINNVKFKMFDLVKDEPYSKYDLILCRNVLIYFNKYLQDKVTKKFHKVLYKNGFLGIGNRESLVWSSVNYKFKTISGENKIFQLKSH